MLAKWGRDGKAFTSHSPDFREYAFNSSSSVSSESSPLPPDQVTPSLPLPRISCKAYKKKVKLYLIWLSYSSSVLINQGVFTNSNKNV